MFDDPLRRGRAGPVGSCLWRPCDLKRLRDGVRIRHLTVRLIAPLSAAAWVARGRSLPENELLVSSCPLETPSEKAVAPPSSGMGLLFVRRLSAKTGRR